MSVLKSIKNFFKDFWDRSNIFYSLYSLIASTFVLSLLIFYFSIDFIFITLIEISVLLLPIIYFYLFLYENKIFCENFYYLEKLGRYKRKPQLINKENEIIIINSKKYLFYFQLKIGKRIKNYELGWKKKENIEITLEDILPILEFNSNKIICKKNENYSYNLAIEYIYLSSEPIDTEFILNSKIKKKSKVIKKLDIKLR